MRPAEAELPALAPYWPRQLLCEFCRSLHRELDLAGECRHDERLARNMAVLPFVQIPRIHWAWTRERVNVQDCVDGIAGHDLGQLDTAGLTFPLATLLPSTISAGSPPLFDDFFGTTNVSDFSSAWTTGLWLWALPVPPAPRGSGTAEISQLACRKASQHAQGL